MRFSLLSLVLVAGCGLTSVQAAVWDYTISVPDGREATFEVPFPVDYAGPVTIDATWEGPRLLFFGVEGPERTTLSRRSGPSPQRVQFDVDAASLARGTEFKLTVKALPARGEASGRLRIATPDAPEVVAQREAELHPPPPPPPPPPAWMLRTDAPPGANLDTSRLYEAVEAFRAAVLEVTSGPADACSWQLGFLKYAVAARDQLADRGAAPDVPTLRYFGRLAAAIGGVDLLRTSTDPVIAGPIPLNRDDRREWLYARNEIVRPIERSLDVLTELLRRGHAPALEDEVWLPRLNACLTACERNFDERVRLGGDENAPNRDLAAAQWDRILAAGRVFEAWKPFLKEPRPPDP
jgi:hypothetical protein